MNPWDDLRKSLQHLQFTLIEGVKITSNALERIKRNEQTSKAPGSAFGDHPDPHPRAPQEAPGASVAHDWLRTAGAHAASDRRVRDAPGGEARPAGRGDTSHDAPRVQARPDERSSVAALTSKAIVCPTCYLAFNVTLVNEPRTPAPGMLWYCHECGEISAFDYNLDLAIATEAQKAKSGRAI
jgi:hypothetical protein